jgi:acyl-CoA synthetase (AMP-forming)/AMP-acid ligase II
MRDASGWKSAMLHGAHGSVALAEIAEGTLLNGRRDELVGRSVMLRTVDQVSAALAVVELDGLAKRIVLGPPDLADDHLPGVIDSAQVDAIVSDRPTPRSQAERVLPFLLAKAIAPAPSPSSTYTSEWLLFTSGTVGAPKMAAHSLAGLIGAIGSGRATDPGPVWATFYDIRRYGGLQILLRALIGGGSIVLSSAEETTGDFLLRMASYGVTHLSGTPSHWRGALMSGSIDAISPRYVRLSGEIADQAILDALRGRFPHATISHAFASTEAGVCFEVDDGREGVPSAMLDAIGGDVEMRVVNDSLCVRSNRTATGYVGAGATALLDSNGFVDTDDLLKRRGDRYYFVGRRSGVINVGGLKVHPEEIEAVINRHPAVRMSLVAGRRNPIVGEIVVADVVLNEQSEGLNFRLDAETVRVEIQASCRQNLSPFKIPARIRFVNDLPFTPGGKIARAHA